MIKAAYRTLMFKCRYHPDLGGDEERARKINEAYRVLRDPEKRREYDLALDPGAFELKRATKDCFERRRIPRIEVNFKVTYEKDREKSLPAKVLDISLLGCRMQTAEPLKVGTKIRVNIEGYNIEGKVRWKRMFHPTIFQRIHEAGIEFIKDFDAIDNLRT